MKVRRIDPKAFKNPGNDELPDPSEWGILSQTTDQLEIKQHDAENYDQSHSPDTLIIDSIPGKVKLFKTPIIDKMRIVGYGPFDRNAFQIREVSISDIQESKFKIRSLLMPL
jgi:hypothetical protein